MFFWLTLINDEIGQFLLMRRNLLCLKIKPKIWRNTKFTVDTIYHSAWSIVRLFRVRNDGFKYESFTVHFVMKICIHTIITRFNVIWIRFLCRQTIRYVKIKAIPQKNHLAEIVFRWIRNWCDFWENVAFAQANTAHFPEFFWNP